MTEKEAMRARLYQAIDECGDTLRDVARHIGADYTYLSALRTKSNYILSAHYIAAFCKHYHYSPTWILLGQGKPKAEHNDQLDRIEKILDELIMKLLDGLLTPKHLQDRGLINLIQDARKPRS
jgi:exonuclease V gamma subunit